MSELDFAARGLALSGAAQLAASGPGKGTALVGHRLAAADAVTRTLASRLEDQISVKDFGAVGDGIADDSIAIRNALRALKSRSSLYSGMRHGTGSLYFPEGVYRITQSGVLSNTDAVTRSGYTLRGAGRNNTILWLDPAGASAAKWFYDNGATQRLAEATFEDICFAGGTTWQTANPATNAGNGYANVNQFIKGFKVSGPGWENNFTFNRCQFRFLETVFQASGSNNSDTHIFTSCLVAKCINVTVVDNPQAMNITWLGYYLSEIYGDTLRYTANAIGGGNFLMQGGAVIAQTYTGMASPAYVVRCVDGGTTASSLPVVFDNVRFELRDNFHGFANVTMAQTTVTAKDCSFWNTGTLDKNFITVGNSCTVKMNGGAHHNGDNGGRLMIVVSDPVGRRGKNAHLIFSNGYLLPPTIFGEISYTGTGGRLTIDETCSTHAVLDTTGDNHAIAYACDVRQPGEYQNTKNRTSRRTSAPILKSAGPQVGAAGVTGATVLLPPWVTLVEAWVKLPAGQGNASTIRCLLGNKDKTVIYGQTTAGAQNAGQYLKVDLQMLRVENDANKREVRVWFDNGAGGNSAASPAGLCYTGVVYE
jgi:Pectate lyase superfamily protein